VRPRLVVALGGSAASALLGRRVAVGKTRGQPIPSAPTTLWITVHPSYLLRIPDAPARKAEFARFVKDLAGAHAWLATHPRSLA
jgi:uracil-DNA glycosylase